MVDASSFPTCDYNMRKGTKQPPDQLVYVKIPKSKEEQRAIVFRPLSGSGHVSTIILSIYLYVGYLIIDAIRIKDTTVSTIIL